MTEEICQGTEGLVKMRAWTVTILEITINVINTKDRSLKWFFKCVTSNHHQNFRFHIFRFVFRAQDNLGVVNWGDVVTRNYITFIELLICFLRVLFNLFFLNSRKSLLLSQLCNKRDKVRHWNNRPKVKQLVSKRVHILTNPDFSISNGHVISQTTSF